MISSESIQSALSSVMETSTGTSELMITSTCFRPAAAPSSPVADALALDEAEAVAPVVSVAPAKSAALLAGYAGLVPRGLDAFEPEARRWIYGRIRLKVFGHQDGRIVATWAFGPDASVISEYTNQERGNAYLGLGEVLTKLGREDEAREAYGKGIGQVEKFGDSGMAEELRLAQVQRGG